MNRPAIHDNIRSLATNACRRSAADPRWLVLVILLTGLLGCESDVPEPVKQEVIRPAKIVTVGETADNLRVFPAEVKASDRSELAFRVGGKIHQLDVKSGSQVKKGDLLAQLDQSDYKLKVDDRQAKFNLAKVQYDRAEKLVADKLISRADFDKAKSRFQAADADMKLALADLQYTSLRAPFDGRISRVLVKNFENIQPNNPVLIVQSENSIDLEFYVPESIIAKARERRPEDRQRAIVKVDQYPGREFTAAVKEFDTEADPSTQAYRAVVTMDMPAEITILPGMTASVIVNMDKMNDVDKSRMVVPVESVFVLEEDAVDIQKQYVWEYDSDTQMVSRVEVVVGELTGDGLVLLDGLSEGDQIVAAGVNFLREGQKVRPIEHERGL